MARAHLARLHDILAMIDAVAEMIAGYDLAVFEGDFRTQKAVERCIEIISEASRRIPETEKSRYPDIPWSAIAAIGNVFRHEYQRIAAPLLWRTASNSLPTLRPTIVELIARAKTGG